uniref:sulfotransferase 1C2-like isoform X1 n=2 Tax=Styela clava TaxID=7725 RepID=UPI00193A7D12|nr:sulfotransferase 1C2-like isoform X1 [Styela clava]
MMIFAISGTAVALFAFIVYYKVKSMRLVDRMQLLLMILTKLNVMKILQITGLDQKMRPGLTHFTASNGFKIMLTPVFASVVSEVLKFKVREDDVFIVTYPKAGTTWMQEITWLICNDGNIDGAKKELITMRSPFLETVDIPISKGIQSLETWPKNKQRVIKTHLPYEILPAEIRNGKKCKIIYVARNPKDLCVSYFHFHRMITGLPNPETWREFLSKFCSDNVVGGSWFDHTLKFWEKYQDDKQRIYFVKYEDLKKDLRKEVESISKFLGKELSGEQMDAISKHCTFGSMSKNKKTNMSPLAKYGMDVAKSKFMRKGEVGDWKNYFTINQSSAFDRMYQEKVEGSGLDITFEM